MARRSTEQQRVTYIVTRDGGDHAGLINASPEAPSRKEMIEQLRASDARRKSMALAELRDIRWREKIADDDLVVLTKLGSQRPKEVK